MSEIIIVAIIGAIGAVIGAAISAAISAYATIRAARLKEMPEEVPEDDGSRKSGKNLLIFGVIIGGILGLVSGYFLIPFIESITSQINSPNIPLETIKHYDFETFQDPTDVRPWNVFPETKTHQLIISNEQANSGDSSLRLKMQIQPLSVDENEYGAIGISLENNPTFVSEKLVAATAWILLPQSEQVQDNDIYTHIIGEIYDSNTRISIYSEDVKLIPGVWTPVFWSATYRIDSEDFNFSSDKNTSHLYLTVWDSDQPYDGSVYIDDIVLYTDK